MDPQLENLKKQPHNPLNEFEEFNQIVEELPAALILRDRISKIFRSIHQKMNQGLYSEDILNSLFSSLNTIIPYDRIGIALLDADGKKIRLHWVKSKINGSAIKKDYAAEVRSSSLNEIIETGKPRIINDLEEYYDVHPRSISTERILMDGIRSNLTCPLMVDGRPIGVIFFSSCVPFCYDPFHIDIFCEISEEISLIIEKELLRERISSATEKERLFNQAIHDINNPLNIILAVLDVTQKKSWFKQLDKESQKTFQMLKRNCDCMIKIIKGLTYSEASSTDETTLLKEFLQDMAEEARLLGNQKQIKIKVNDGDNLPATVPIASYLLKEALENLISNAIKFSPPNSEVEISAEFKRSEDIVIFMVKDHGKGIPKEEQEKLFRPFSKTSVKPTAGEPSSGQGLASVKSLIEKLGGKVFFESKAAEGSNFGFSVPLH